MSGVAAWLGMDERVDWGREQGCCGSWSKIKKLTFQCTRSINQESGIDQSAYVAQGFSPVTFATGTDGAMGTVEKNRWWLQNDMAIWVTWPPHGSIWFDSWLGIQNIQFIVYFWYLYKNLVFLGAFKSSWGGLSNGAYTIWLCKN